MKGILELFATLMICVSLLAVLSSCGESTDPAQVNELTLFADGVSEYMIVYAKGNSRLSAEAAAYVRATFMNKYGAAPGIESDVMYDGDLFERKKEILIGLTDRSESLDAAAQLEENSFLIKAYGDNIVIVADSDKTLVKAIRYFTGTYIDPSTDTVSVPKDLNYLGTEQNDPSVIYNVDGSATLQLLDFKITYDSSNIQLYIPSVARSLVKRVNELYTLVDSSEDSVESELEILFGKCDRTHFKEYSSDFLFRDFYLCFDEGKLSVSAFSIYGYARAVEFLLDAFDQGSITIPRDGLYSEYDYGDDAYGQLRRNYENPQLDGAWMINVSHRGDTTTNNYPENSIPSYLSCINNRVDIIETDLMLTNDGVWVICHDETINRTTNGTGRVADMTLEQLAAYRLMTENGGATSTVTEYTIPTLEDVIVLGKGRVIYNLDKIGKADFQSVYDVFEKNGAVEMALFKGNVPSSEIIAWFCELIEQGRALPLYMPMFYSDYESIESSIHSFAGLTVMFESGDQHSAKTVKVIKDANIRLMCLTALNPALENFEYYNELKDLGYGAIMTDAPKLLKEFIHGNQ